MLSFYFHGISDDASNTYGVRDTNYTPNSVFAMLLFYFHSFISHTFSAYEKCVHQMFHELSNVLFIIPSPYFQAEFYLNYDGNGCHICNENYVS